MTPVIFATDGIVHAAKTRVASKGKVRQSEVAVAYMCGDKGLDRCVDRDTSYDEAVLLNGKSRPWLSKLFGGILANQIKALSANQLCHGRGREKKSRLVAQFARGLG